MHASALDSDGWLDSSRRRKDAECVDQPMMIEVPVDHAGVKRVAEQIVGAIDAESVAGTISVRSSSQGVNSFGSRFQSFSPTAAFATSSGVIGGFIVPQISHIRSLKMTSTESCS